MVDAGLLQPGDEPSGEQYVMYLRRLRDLINLWQTQGLKMWLQFDQSVTLIASQQKYTMKPTGDVNITKPLRVIQGYYSDSNNIKRPLNVLSRDDWTRLSQTTQTGAVNSYFVDKLATQLDVYFWLTPDATAATGTAHPIIQQQVTVPTTLNETMNFPEEWRMALRWGLADDICGGQPQAIMDRCQARALAYRTMLEDWDVEDASTFFTPNTQMQAGSIGRFR
jgi:hypothetical protein